MSELLITLSTTLLLILLGLAIRFRPFWINPNLGVDHWYWLLCAEDVKRRRKLPPRLPYFMLEIEEQWYPPLYAGLLSLLPMKWLEKHGGKLSQSIDLLQAIVIFLSVYWVSNNTIIAFLSGLSYMIAYFPMSCNIQLQPRSLANLLLTLVMVGLWFYIDTGSFAIWGGVLVISLVLLFLHKMTVQMWVIYILGFGIWDWKILLLLPAAVLLAIIVSKGFYIKMLRAHWDIVSFWHENINFLLGHQYYESPLYYKRDELRPIPWQHNSAKRFFLRLLGIPQYNVFALLLLPLIYFAITHPQGRLEIFLWTWVVLTYLWAFSTTLFPYFKALGTGSFYVYYTYFPLFLLSGISTRFMPVSFRWWLFVFWAISLSFSIIAWVRFCKSIARSKTASVGEDFREVLSYLKNLPKDGVFCIPFHLLDATAYWTRKKVFWGGHSYGFHKLLKPYFPIMRADVKDTLRKKPLNYLLFWRGYLNSLKDIGLEEGEDIRSLFSKGEYALYEVVK